MMTEEGFGTSACDYVHAVHDAVVLSNQGHTKCPQLGFEGEKPAGGVWSASR